ncbi:MAG: class I SAM-dependent methyltransferase [Myxococcota bacterium]
MMHLESTWRALGLLVVGGALGCAGTECPEPASPETPAAAEGHAPTDGARAQKAGHDHHRDHGRRAGELHRDHGRRAGELHRFEDPEQWKDHFEGPDRDAWQKPEAVLDRLALEPADVVADVGAGTGYFAVRLAARVPEGRVWAVDVEPGMVRHVNARARDQGIDNLFAVLGRPDDPMLPEPVDLVLVVNTYHHIEDRTAYFRGLRSRLKEGGRVAIVDFVMGDIPVGPPEEMRIPPDRARRELEAAGYDSITVDEETLPHQYVLVAR